MLLIDQRPLELEQALNDKGHPQHDFAKFYDEKLKSLKARHKNGYVRFKRPGYPRHIKGADSRGMEIPKVAEPVPPMRIPLKGYAITGSKGKHLWMCCTDPPTILPNQLWDLGRNRSLSIKDDYLVNLEDNPELAFFLAEISVHTKKGRLRLLDPVADDDEVGRAEELIALRKNAVWNLLPDVEKLKTMARAYGVNKVDEKQPNAIRKALEEQLTKNDEAQKRNPAVKGTREFIEEMRVTESVLLRNFIQKAIDDKKLAVSSASGHWKIGEKFIYQVPASDFGDRRNYGEKAKNSLCNWLMAGQNAERLQEFLKDLLSMEYFDAIADTKDGNKEWVWLAKVAKKKFEFTKMDVLKTEVRQFYCPLG